MTIKIFSTIVLTLALLVGAGAADAGDREGRWEYALGLNYQFGTDLEFDGGSTIDTDSEIGFVTDFGYNFSDNLQVSFGFQYGGIGYDAVVIDEDGNDIGIKGSYDAWNFSSNVIYNFIDGPITPYVGAGIGYTWIDTNVPNGPPQGVCWWDPWWGYVCYETYPTKTEDAFSYQMLLGLRYEFNEMTFMKFGYTSQWMDFPNADGTPRFDMFLLEIGWVF